MRKRIFLSAILLIGAAYAMEKTNEDPLLETRPLSAAAPANKSSLHKLKNCATQNLDRARASIHKALNDNPYLFGIKIINTSKLYTVRITGGTLNQTIELNPVVHDPKEGPQYDVQYLLLNPMSSIRIQTFRPGSAIANEMPFRRLRGQDVLVINVDRIQHTKKFYPPIIMIDPYSIKEARDLYPNLDL